MVLQEIRCPVPGCPAVAHSAGRLSECFMYRYFRYKVAVVQEGKEPLPCCDWCIMHIPAGRLIRNRKTAHCNRNTQMRWRRQDVEIVARCLEKAFSMTGEEEAEIIEGVGSFKYLGRLMERSHNDSTEVLHITRKARQVWGWLRKLLWREGAEPTVPEKFYRAVVQVVLLFEGETRVLTETTIQQLEGAHVIFLRQVT